MQVEEARQVLDRFAVAERLQHIRRFVWRAGALRYFAQADCAYYELFAEHDVRVLEPTSAAQAGLERNSTPVVEGRWVQRTTSHVLRIGIDLAVPSAIFIRGEQLHALVPYLCRPDAQVERVIHAELAAYVNRSTG